MFILKDHDVSSDIRAAKIGPGLLGVLFQVETCNGKQHNRLPLTSEQETTVTKEQ
jgi:hypothetical protein